VDVRRRATPPYAPPQAAQQRNLNRHNSNLTGSTCSKSSSAQIRKRRAKSAILTTLHKLMSRDLHAFGSAGQVELLA